MYLSSRNQSIDGWFLYDRAFRYELVERAMMIFNKMKIFNKKAVLKYLGFPTQRMHHETGMV